jgi:hypothetical protein
VPRRNDSTTLVIKFNYNVVTSSGYEMAQMIINPDVVQV